MRGGGNNNNSSHNKPFFMHVHCSVFNFDVPVWIFIQIDSLLSFLGPLLDILISIRWTLSDWICPVRLNVYVTKLKQNWFSLDGCIQFLFSSHFFRSITLSPRPIFIAIFFLWFQYCDIIIFFNERKKVKCTVFLRCVFLSP